MIKDCRTCEKCNEYGSCALGSAYEIQNCIENNLEYYIEREEEDNERE